MPGREASVPKTFFRGRGVHVSVALIAALVLAAPRTGAAEQASPAHTLARVGVMGGCQFVNDPNSIISALRDGLRQAGWIEGQNLILDFRCGDGSSAGMSEVAAQLVALNPDVITVGGVVPAQVLMRATTTIPIVLTGVSDPVGSGLIASLDRPGGNVTGTSFTVGAGTGAQRLALLREMLPTISRVAVVYDTTYPAGVNDFHSIQRAADELGVEIVDVGVSSPDEVDRVLGASLAQSPEGLLSGGGGLILGNSPAMASISQFANVHQLPLIGGGSGWPAVGALASYGPDFNERYRRAGAYYIDRILRGAKPAELPVEEPSFLLLTVNRTTAQALGLTIPQSIVDQVADWVD